MWKQKSWSQPKFALGMLYHACFFTVRNIFFPYRRAMLWRQRWKSPCTDPGAQPWQEGGCCSSSSEPCYSLGPWGIENVQLLEVGQEDCGGIDASPSLLWCLTQLLISWVGFLLGGEVVWIVIQIVHSDRNGVWELLLSRFSLIVTFLPFSHLAGVVLPYLCSLWKCPGQQCSTII